MYFWYDQTGRQMGYGAKRMFSGRTNGDLNAPTGSRQVA